jgi:hypothetical protein
LVHALKLYRSNLMVGGLTTDTKEEAKK